MKTDVLGAAALASDSPFPGAEYVGNCELRPTDRQACNVLWDEGLDGRLYTDLSKLTASCSVVPTPEFFIRTSASRWLPDPADWQVRIGNQSLAATWFDAQRVPLGDILMECSGNDRVAAHRMLSVANWEGVPLGTVLEKTNLARTSDYLQVSGFDEYPTPSHFNPPSIPGADWVFPLDRLLASAPALVTRMNGELLTRDHGAPLRLIVPNWYGCANIKWVNDIRFVPDDTPSTSHMRWFASRTRQTGVPELARDYRDPRIQVSAMAVRVEHWRYAGRPLYRIVGITWGGERPAPGLIIRCGKEGTPIYRVGHYVPPPHSRAWGLWYHHFIPPHPGRFPICLQTNPPSVKTRLAEGYYLRFVTIPEA